MKKEDYVSFEVAKLLKEKGYQTNVDEDRWVYNKDGSKMFFIYILSGLEVINGKPLIYYKPFTNYTAPSLWDAQRWLRDKYAININVHFDTNLKWEWYSFKCKKYEDYFIDNMCNFDTYEEALNEGIKEALRTI